MASEIIKVPDLGGAESVEVIEVCVKPGDSVAEEDSLVVLESDKASMDVPSPLGGKVLTLLVKEGDTISEGDPILELETGAASASSEAQEKAPKPQQKEEPKPAAKEAEPTKNETPVTSSVEDMLLPDTGSDDAVEIIEISVKVGDKVSEGDSILVLETDKATVEMPAPSNGIIKSIAVKEGDKVKQGDLIGAIETSSSAPAESSQSAAPSEAVAEPVVSESKPAAPATISGAKAVADMILPDTGSDSPVEIIEISVKAGDQVSEGDSILVLETDKATVEMPAPSTGTIKSIAVKEGDKVSTGDLIGTIETEGSAPSATEQPAAATPPKTEQPAKDESKPAAKATAAPQQAVVASSSAGGAVYAGPAVRLMARKLGVDLGKVNGTGPRNRILKEDVEEFVKQGLARLEQGGATAGSGIPKVPEVDFSKFGEIEILPMTKIQKVTAANMTRAWLNVPHVTQFDEADITEMEEFRKSLKAEGEKQGIKITPLAFLLKACASALLANPDFNRSISADGESFVQKHYINIGVAVDTPRGLMVPVVKDVDKKGLWQLADEANMMAAKAREGKLSPNEMQGGCFTISSLGGIGGTGFTPIVSPPELAILGVSKSQIKPVWNGKDFEPRLMLPLSVSYDHRAINGAGCGRFFTYLVDLLSDVRRLSLK